MTTPRGDYNYPAAESITDALERAMDPYKLEREQAVLELLVTYDWQSAIDVGCGIGRYFGLFASIASRTPQRRRRLPGLEPDAARRGQAELAVAELSARSPLVISTGAGLDDRDRGSAHDLLVCIQVLGHLTHDETRQLLADLRSRKVACGRIVIAIPVVMNDGISQLVPWPGSPASDYFFEVNLERTPFQADYARPLTADDYDRVVMQGAAGRLPVRAFNIGSLDADSLASCPAPVVTLPADVTAAFGEERVVGLVYSFHRFSTSTGHAILGDAILPIG